MAFEDRTEIVGVRLEQRMCLRTPETALWLFRRGTHVRARVVWVDPGAATPEVDDDTA